MIHHMIHIQCLLFLILIGNQLNDWTVHKHMYVDHIAKLPVYTNTSNVVSQKSGNIVHLRLFKCNALRKIISSCKYIHWHPYCSYDIDFPIISYYREYQHFIIFFLPICHFQINIYKNMDTYLVLYLHGEGSHNSEHQSDVVTVLHPPTTCQITPLLGKQIRKL